MKMYAVMLALLMFMVSPLVVAANQDQLAQPPSGGHNSAARPAQHNHSEAPHPATPNNRNNANPAQHQHNNNWNNTPQYNGSQYNHSRYNHTRYNSSSYYYPYGYEDGPVVYYDDSGTSQSVQANDDGSDPDDTDADVMNPGVYATPDNSNGDNNNVVDDTNDSGDDQAYIQCGQWLEEYNIVPYKDWGSAPPQIQKIWNAQDCNHQVCQYMKDTYTVVPHQSWGGLPANLQAIWKMPEMDCSHNVE